MTGTASLRTRWAAIGAAVAVTLGGGITFAAQALTDPTPTAGNAYTPITPCRLMDTRGGSNTVGPRDTPIQGGTSYEAAVHGTNGNCDIPTAATGIATNTTVLNGTEASFLTIYPADVARPDASNLNWTAGQSATPNQVTVGLSADGKISIYNDRGAVNVIVDIVGIYTDPTAALDARYLTEATADGRYFTQAAADDRFATLDDLDGTVRRTMSFPAQALNLNPNQSDDIAPGTYSLLWSTDGRASAHLPMQRPADFAGTGTVTVTLTFNRSDMNLGTAGFWVRPRSAPMNAPMPDVLAVPSDRVEIVTEVRYYTVTVNFPAASLAGEFWELVFQRQTPAYIGPDAADQPLRVYGVSVSYDALR